MRLKVEPGDFYVREDLRFPEVRGGEYFVHVLRKEKLDTQEALARLARMANVRREDLAFAGLKDRQGRTEQWISIRGKRFEYRSRNLTVLFRGRTDRPVNSQMSRGNRFEIVVRDLGREEVATIQANAARIELEGLPNYFDDQRFGCLRHGQGFVMRSILLGDHEEALRKLIAHPSPIAITGDVKLKRVLAKRWGDWEACAGVARGPVYQRVFEHLREKRGGFREALELLPTRVKLIHSFAYQSYLWNRAVDRMLHGMLARGARVSLRSLTGWLTAWDKPFREVLADLKQLDTPLHGPEGPAGSPEFRKAVQEILVEQGLRQVDLDAAAIPGMKWRAEERALGVRPRQFSLSEDSPDETERGRRKVSLAFALPRGSYATLVVKRLLAGVESGRRPAPAHRRGRRASGMSSSNGDSTQ